MVPELAQEQKGSQDTTGKGEEASPVVAACGHIADVAGTLVGAMTYQLGAALASG